jgi:hypothetical protein
MKPSLVLLILSLASTALAEEGVWADKSGKPADELVIRIGNESNQNDGVFGPFT